MDEASPSEDERAAMQVIQGGNTSTVQESQLVQGWDQHSEQDPEDNTYNVLEDYCHRNHPNCPPKVKQLITASAMQNSVDEEDLEDLEPSVQKRALQTAKEVDKLDPETLTTLRPGKLSFNMPKSNIGAMSFYSKLFQNVNMILLLHKKSSLSVSWNVRKRGLY